MHFLLFKLFYLASFLFFVFLCIIYLFFMYYNLIFVLKYMLSLQDGFLLVNFFVIYFVHDQKQKDRETKFLNGFRWKLLSIHRMHFLLFKLFYLASFYFFVFLCIIYFLFFIFFMYYNLIFVLKYMPFLQDG